jgi:phenylphosphate carboxylase gamma subunit
MEVKLMARKQYDTFLLEDPAGVPQEQELELIVRDLTPADRRLKYRSFYAKARVSKSKDALEDQLWVRLGRGQLLEKPWSIQILEEVNKFA